jgi:transposase-like protein
MRFVRELTVEEAEELRRRHRQGATGRERTRALAVLMSSRGHPMKELAALFGVRREAVSGWLDGWEQGGASALSDRPRAGRPPKLGVPEQAEVVAAARASPANPPRELAKKGACCPPVGTR